MHLLHFLISFLVGGPSAVAPPDTLSCATDELHATLIASDSTYAAETTAMEADWGEFAGAKKVKKRGDEKSSATPPYVLPIVFHLIHENGAENLPDSDILRSVDFLNQALANTDYYDPATGVPTQISVCLALRTPDNQPTNGITRHVSPLTDLHSDDDRTMKDLARWNPRDYVNVYVVRRTCGLGIGCGLAGYAYYPSAHGRDIDGIVMEARWLAGDEAGVGVLIHELGHYLGLRHTFDGGCLNDDCLRNGDRVCDTPPDQSKVAVPCSGTANSCTTDTDSGFATDQDDMFINYMDYGYFRCYSAFTAGQRDRMHFFLDGRRRSLLESQGCLPPCPALTTADFTGGDITINAGDNLTFTNQSQNGDRYRWSQDGTPFSTANSPTRTFPAVGTYRIKLVAYPADATLCRADSVEQIVTVVCPVVNNFTLSGEVFNVGDTLRTINNSENGNSSRWTVNDNEVGTSQNLELPLQSPGLFTVCLEETTAFCGQSACQTVYVARPPCSGPDCPNTCGAPFSARYAPVRDDNGGTPGGTAYFRCVVAVPGGYVVGGSADGRPLLMRLTDGGNIVWQRELTVEGDAAEIRSLTLGNTGEVFGVGSLALGELGGSFYTSVDLATGNERFLQQPFFQDSSLWLHHVVLPRAGGPLLLLGEQRGITAGFADLQPCLLRVDPLTGVPVGDLTFQRSSADHQLVFDAALDPNTGITYVTGNAGAPTSAAYLQAISPGGKPLWTRTLSYPGTLTDGFFQLAVDGDRLVLFDLAASTGTSGTSSQLNVVITDLRGENARTSAHQLFTAGGSTEELLVNDLGYLLISRLPGGQLRYTQTDRGGAVLFQQTAGPLATSPDLRGSQALALGNRLVVAGRDFDLTTPGGGGFLPGLASFTVSPVGLVSCFPAQDEMTEPTQQRLANEPLAVTTDSVVAETFELDGAPANFVLAAEYCRGDCPEEEEEEDLPCFAPFVEEYESLPAQSDIEGISSLLPTPQGKFIAFNRGVGSGISFFDNSGVEVWSVVAQNSSFMRVNSLKLDSEGFLIGTGFSAQPLRGNGVAFRINAQTGETSWFRRLNTETTPLEGTDIFELEPGGDYLVAARLSTSSEFSLSSASLLQTLRRSDGESLGEATFFRQISGRPNDRFEHYGAAVQPSTGNTYLHGRSRIGFNFVPSVICLGPDRSVRWEHAYQGFNNHDGVVELITEEDSQVMITTGASVGLAREGVGITRIDTDGEIVWSRQVELDLDFFPTSAVPNKYGYLIFGTSPFPLSVITSVDVIVQVDNNGTALWSRRYFPRRTGAGKPLATLGENIYYAPEQFGINPTRLTRLRANGTGPADCFASLPLSYTTTTVPMEMLEFTAPAQQLSLTSVSSALIAGSSLRVTTLCSASCCPDTLPDQLFLPTDTTVCPGFVLRAAYDFEAATYRWSDGSVGDSLLISEPGTYGLTVTNGCGDSLADQLSLHLRPRRLLDLGPDTTLCANAVVPLTAQEGFATYEWSDGTDERDFTAFEAGVYWVNATDSCGRVSTDSVRVTITPGSEIDLGPERTICAGDTLAFSVPGYTDYQWSNSSFIDCTDCPEVKFAPMADTLLLVAAKSGPGCFSSDSVRVRVVTGTGSRTMASLCPGDTILFGGSAVTTAGQFYAQAPSAGCTTTDTLDVVLLRDTTITRQRAICAGDSALIFGRFEYLAGTYRQTLPSVVTGCDSTEIVELAVNDVFFNSDTLTICSGDSALIFGVWQRVSANYSRTFPTVQTGCDSVQQFVLRVDDFSITTNATKADCGGADAGAGEVMLNGNAGATIRWDNGTTTHTIDGLAAGTYGVTATNAAGCTASASLTIETGQATPLAYEVSPESCPGEGDGRLDIIGATTAMSFRLNTGEDQAAPTFGNLPPGDYQLVVTDQNACDQSFAFTVDAAQPRLFELPEDLTIQLGDSVTIVPNTDLPAGSTFDWLAQPGDSCRGCPSLSLTPQTTTLVTATAGLDGNCPLEDQLRITVDRQGLFYVPTAFSPNGDNVNDFFRVFPSPAVEEILSFRIFDRWGGQVFEASNLAPADELAAWDGTRPNRPDPMIGVYVYTLELRLFNGEVITTFGEVMLMR